MREPAKLKGASWDPPRDPEAPGMALTPEETRAVFEVLLPEPRKYEKLNHTVERLQAVANAGLRHFDGYSDLLGGRIENRFLNGFEGEGIERFSKVMAQMCQWRSDAKARPMLARKMVQALAEDDHRPISDYLRVLGWYRTWQEVHEHHKDCPAVLMEVAEQVSNNRVKGYGCYLPILRDPNADSIYSLSIACFLADHLHEEDFTLSHALELATTLLNSPVGHNLKDHGSLLEAVVWATVKKGDKADKVDVGLLFPFLRVLGGRFGDQALKKLGPEIRDLLSKPFQSPHLSPEEGSAYFEAQAWDLDPLKDAGLAEPTPHLARVISAGSGGEADGNLALEVRAKTVTAYLERLVKKGDVQWLFLRGNYDLINSLLDVLEPAYGEILRHKGQLKPATAAALEKAMEAVPLGQPFHQWAPFQLPMYRLAMLKAVL